MAENQPRHITTLNAGIEQDQDPEIVGAQTNGLYLDAHNMRPTSTDGSSNAQEKVKGEQVLYPNNKGLSDYTCVGSIVVNNYLTEFWAPNNNTGPGVITVNGVVVLNSVDFELRTTHPLQLDKNESPLNEEVFVTDYRVPPYIFNVKDMVDSLISDPNKYFSAFDPLVYQVNLQSPLDRPVFLELINVGEGLPPGQYEYQLRYGNEAGDRTSWSVGTPLIPVMQGLSTDSRCYPWAKTYGGPPSPSNGTAFAPRIQYRVTNIYNYEFIEIRRVNYNQGAGLDFVPLGKIVARIPIEKQEISVREYIDPADSNLDIAISEIEASKQLAEILRAKSIKYFDRRAVLMNVELASKESELEFKSINGKKIFPVIDFMGYAGHKDPWNHTYKKKYMAGEGFTFGAVGFDGVGGSGFVNTDDDLKNYRFPNRRDPISAETESYSLDNTVKAANTEVTAISQTHEVFDLGDSTFKSDVCSFKNIVRSGKIAGLTGSRTTAKVKEDCDEDDGEVENHGARVSGGIVTVSYQPFSPTKQNDPDVTGHEYAVNTKVYTDADTVCVSAEEKEKDYRPTGFSPSYFSMGAIIPGITNIPKWMKAFSIVRTKSAGRVICQGVGFYSLTKAKYKIVGSAELAGKEQNKFWFYSPDVENGIVASDKLNDIIDNPQNYKIQMVSPLGFFSEVYGFEDNLDACNRDRIVDMITYARMIRETPDRPINPGEDPAIGINDGDGNMYVAYDKYRNVTQNPNTFGGDSALGNREFILTSVERKAEGRGQFLELEVGTNVYGAGSTGGASNRHFDNAGLKDFTEPIYIINIIRSDAQVPDDDVQGFKSTGHYQKIESIIGRSNGQMNQRFLLVDERWEDCIPSPRDFHFGNNIDRYVYIKKPNGNIEKWINVTYKTGAQISAIKSDIQSLGSYSGDVKGIYTHNNVGNLNRQFEIVFSDGGFVPAQDDLILVRYDDTAPIRVFGGDSYIGETVFSPIDANADAKSDAAETHFAFGIGFPYFKWKLNPRYYTIRKSGAVTNVIQDELQMQLGYIRQMCVMFCAESRSGIHLAHNLQYPSEFFPLTNYVIRPNRWDEDASLADNGIFNDYEDDYGGEKAQWKWGGFRFLQQVNPDYSCELPIRYFSKPEVGFEEETHFPTGIMRSLPRAINIQNSPGLRTFPANNFFVIDDNCGEIKYAYDDTTGKGENLYAITEKGICLLITKKSILSDFNSGEIGYMSADGFIRGQYWLYKDVGMSDEMWRSAVWNFVPTTGEEGDETRTKALFFTSNQSVFRFMQNTVVDIGRQGYFNKIYNNGLTGILSGYQTHVACAYNKLYHEYWLYIKNGSNHICFVFNQKKGRWTGTNDFRFDRFMSQGNFIYGSKELKTYELNKGYVVNDTPVVGRIKGGTAAAQVSEKEFIEISVNSIQKPTSVRFRKSLNGQVLCELSASVQGPLYLKKYSGFRQFIPRIFASVAADRPRLQNRLLVWEVEHNEASEFKVVDVDVQYKILKLK